MDLMWPKVFQRSNVGLVVNEMFIILIKISMNFVPKGPIDNNPALV